MKKIIVLLVLLCINTGYIYSQTVAGGIFSSQNVLSIRVKPSQSFSGTSISNLTFSIRWDTSYHISVSDMTNSFGILKDGGIQTSGSFNYQNYVTTSPTPITWTANTEYTLGTITISGGSGTGTIELSPTGFTAGGIGDWYVEIGGTSYTPAPGSEYYQSSTVANLYQPGPAAKLGIQTQPSANATAGIAFSTQPVIAIEDAGGNIITTDNSTVVTATRLSGTGTLQGTTTATASNGLATFSNLSYTVAENITIQFASGSLTSATSNTVTVTPAVAAVVRMETAANGTGTIVPAQNVSSGNSITAYAITRDAFNNFIANVGASFWTIQNPTGGIAAGDVVPSGDSTKAVFTGHVIGTGQIIANYGGLTRTASGTISVIAGAPSQVRVETAVDGSGTIVPSQSLPAGNSLTAYAITRDASNNFVANVAASSWSLQNSTGGIVSGDLIPNGDSKSAVFTGHSAGSTQIHATSGVLTATSSGTITIISGGATRVKFAAQPSSTTSGAILSPVTVQVKDASGNNVPSAGITVTLTLVGTGNLFGTVSRTTDATGLATFNNLSIDTVGSKNIITSSSGLTSDTSSAFSVSPGAPKKLIFVQQPTSANTNIVIAPPVTVQVQDSLGNSVTTSGISISVAKASGNTGNLSGTTTQTTNASGLATFNNLSFNQNGSKQLVASSSGLISVTSNPFTISDFTITSSENGTGTISPLGAQSVSGNQNITFTITPNSGSHIDSVVVDGVNKGPDTTYSFTNVTNNHTIAAYFSVTIYTITSSAGLNGTISPNGTTPVNSGSSQSFTITPSTGYHIDSVFVDGSYAGNTSPYNFTNVVANHSISVKFAINQYTITASTGTHGKITPAGSVVVLYGSNQLFTFTPDTGYQIQNVLVDGISQGTVPSYTFSNVTANHTVSVAFTADTLTITVQSIPAGLNVIVDGNTAASPATVKWIVGTNHTLGVVDTVSTGTGSRVVWSSWSNNGAKSQIVSPIVPTTFIANFITQYYLTDTANAGGTVTPPSGWFTSGQNVQIQAFPSAKYNFQTWSGSGNGSISSSTNPATITMNNAISEIANFVRQPIQITIQASPSGLTFYYDGQSYNTPQTRTVNPGDQHNLNSVSPQSGGSNIQYVFNNWSDSGAIFHVIAPDSNTTYTVNFKKQYNLTVVAGLNGNVSPPSGYLDSGSVTNITATPNTGFIFKKWDGSGTGSYSGTNNPASVTMKSVINDTAFFVIDTMIITATAGANGTISPSGSVKVPYGSNQTFTITPIGLYHISDVVVDGSSVGAVSSYQFTNVTAAHTITASFTLNGYTITATAGANGTITPSGAIGVNGGANQSFTITPNSGYHNDSLFIDNISTAVTPTYQFTNIGANHTIRVTFAPNTQTVKIQSNIAGLLVAADGTTYASPHTFSWLFNSTHTIAAVDTQAGAANTRYTWLIWSDSGAKSHSITIAGDTTFTASFTTQFFLTMNAGTGGTVLPANSWYNAGQSVLISATPSTGYTFSTWVGSGTGSYSGSNATPSVTMNAPITETASFTLTPIHVTVNTNPSGRSFTVDGTTYSTSQNFTWSYGTVHTLSTTSPQAGTTGTQYLWSSWNNGKPISSSVTALNDTTLTATFSTQYYLTTGIDSGGSVTPTSGWQNAGSIVPMTATSNPGFKFKSWTSTGLGSTTDTLNASPSVTMNGPITEIAHFIRFSAQVTVQTNPAGEQVTIDGVTYASPHTIALITGSIHTIAVPDTQSGATGTRYLYSSWNDGGAKSHAVTILSDTTFTASFTTQYFLTTVANQGGTVTPPSSWFNRGQVIPIIATPNANYAFTSWSGLGYSGSLDTATVTMNQPITETASFQHNPIQITVTTYPAGLAYTFNGTPYTTPQSVSFLPGTLVYLGANSPQNGSAGIQYIWKNWNTGSAQYSTYTIPDTNKSITIIANFGTQYLLTTAVTSVGTGGTVTPPSGYLDSGSVATLTATPNTGSIFKKWSGSGTGSYSGTNNPASVTMKSVINDTAFFVVDTMIITATAGANGTISPSGSVKVPYGSNQTFTITPIGLYHISDVVVDGSSVGAVSSYQFTNVTAAHTITASFTLNGYTITATAGANGTITPSGAIGVNGGANQSFTITPNSGYHNDSLFIDNISTAVTPTYQFTNIGANHTIRVTFAPNTQTVKIQSNIAGLLVAADGTTYASPHTFSWLFNSTHTIAAVDTQAGAANTRYTWLSWNDAGAKSHSVTIAGDTTFTVSFTTQFFLTTNADSGSVTPPSSWRNSGAVVPITGIPNPGFKFASWSGTGTGSTSDTLNPSSVTVNGPITETAHFTRFSAQVKVQTNPAGQHIIVDGTSYSSPQVFNWTTGSFHTIAVPDTQTGGVGTRYIFSSWNDNGAISHSVSAASDSTFTANFSTQYYLTMAANVGGSASPPSGWFNRNQVVTIIAIPDVNHLFSSWSGPGYSGSLDTAIVTMTQPMTETASFQHKPIQLTISTYPPGLAFTFNGTPYTTPQTNSFLPGTLIYLGANSPQNIPGQSNIQYVWKNWNTGSAQYSTYTIPDTNSSIAIIANFGIQYLLSTAAGPGGSVTPPTGQWEDSGSVVTLTATPNLGYSFLQWTGKGTGSYTGFNNPATITMNAPLSDSASFSRFTVHITVKSNPPGKPITVDGTVYDTTQTFNWVSGTTHTLIASTQTGDTSTRYIYNNWGDGGSQSHAVTVFGDSTFVANYTTQYYLKMIAGSGGTVSPSSNWFNAGSGVLISATPNATYNFGGWNGTGSGSYSGTQIDTSVTISGPITETASFVLVPIHVTVRTNPAGRTFTVDSVKYSSTQSFIWQYGSTHIIGTSTPQNFSASTQYSWKTWNDGGTIVHSVIPVRDTIFTANFIPQYYLTTLSDTGGTVSPGIGWQDSGKVVTITATPNSGFQFAAWKGGGSGSYSGILNPSTVTMNGPIYDTASFSRFTAQTTVQTVPAGLSIIVDGTTYTSPHTFSWTTGSSHSISSIDTTAGNNGSRYAWGSWNDGGLRTHTVLTVHDTTFTANYITQFYLTMIANVGGTVNPASWWYNSGQTVTITAMPDSTYNFNGWSGGGIGSTNSNISLSQVTMNSPITETANFVRKPVQITIQTNPPGRPFILDGSTWSTAQTRTVNPGDQHYLSVASPQLIDAGIQYVWKNWSDGGLQTHAITIPDSNTTYTALFSKQFYLTTTAGPNGTVSPASNWEDSGSTVVISATGNANYAFSQWSGAGSGSYSGNANPSSVKMNEPISDSASFAPALRVTIASNPPGQSVIIDDSTYTTPAIVYWIKDTLHSIGTTAIQNGTTGIKNTWKQWSDSGAIVHKVSVKDTATFTATFLTQYYFTISGNGHGIVVPSNGWFPKDTSFQIRALPDSGYAFVEWIGTGLDSYSGQNAFATVLMHGPVSESATFGLILPPPTLHGVTNDSVNVATQPVLSWNPYPGATSYRIQVSSDSSVNPDGTFKNPAFDSALITTTQVQTDPLANLTYYYWHVDVRAGNNISTFSSAWTFTTLGATITTATPVVNWATGYVFPITWSSSSLSGPVTIKLSHNGGNSYQIIQQNHPNTGNTIWRIPDSTVYISQNCLIRVESALNANIFDVSSSFAILSGHLPTAVPLTTLIPFPGAPSVSTEYRLFSGPGLVDTIRVSSFLFGNQKTDWRIYSDDGSVENYLTELSASSFLQTGAGYWLIKKGNLNIPTYRMVMPPLDSTATFGIPLHSGWNIIGDPFDESIPWQAVLDANNLPPATAVLGYNGSYAQSFSLAPFQGYYYFNTSNAGILKMPYPFGSSRIAPATTPQISWELQLSTESDINTDAENYIGIAPTATTGANQFNKHKPPLFQDQSFLYFSRPEWDKVYSRYSSDIRPSLDQGQVWNFEVTNPRKSKSTIRVNGIENVPAGMEVMLIDRLNSSPVDLRKNSNYVYQTISPEMQFEIIVGTKEYVTQQIKSLVPKTFELEQNYPNPFNLSTAIGVQLPHDSRIRLAIYSVLGQLVKTLADGEFSQGVHTFWWNGEDASGKITASGVYFYRLIEGTQVLQTKKMVLTK